MSTIEAVKEYYGKILSTSKDLKTNACCTVESFPSYLKPIVAEIHQTVRERYYGCGLVIPPHLNGLTVLDLGSGSGRDCFILSKLVGPSGHVIGIDMTDEQLAVANEYIPFHTKQFGYNRPNVEFKKAYIEDLETAGIASNSVDLVVSNCVINLSPDKERVLRELWRVLKPGGELYFSDVYADRRLPEHCRHDQELLGECLGGAMYKEDFRRLMMSIGCQDFRVVSSAPIEVQDESLRSKLGLATFTSITVRAFKIPLEDKCEDYGQVATYLGTIKESPQAFLLDDHHFFVSGKPMLVCSNTAAMVAGTRYGEHFRVDGDLSRHYGLFDCSTPAASVSAQSAACGVACC